MSDSREHDVRGPWVSLPRSRRLEVQTNARPGARPSLRRNEPFRASVGQALGRLVYWLYAALRFVLGTLGDKLRRRDCIERRAERLRTTIESVGTTFIKLGQQLSIRLDMLPYAYIRELEKMLDRVPDHMPRATLVERLEEAVGRPIESVFARFDPKPIGSGSVACVYQAYLQNGDRVAVKVRRPGIGVRLAADLRALGWLMYFFELFVIPPGTSKTFVFELRTMLMEELDFAREARYAELFRKETKRVGLRWVSAPKVYHAYSNSCVVVTEYVAGVWLTDLLRVVENGDRAALEALRNKGIRPKKVARRLIRISRFGGMEGMLFHADLHPANVLVRPKSKITLIDFGSCGSQTAQERRVWRRFLFAQERGDVAGIADATLGLFNTLPPIEVEEFKKRIESVYWQDLYAHASRHAEWWERTSVMPWVGVLKLTREYKIPVPLNTVRMIRLSLLADTLAARLYHQIDHYEEYRRFEVGAGERARRRLKQRLRGLASPRMFLRYEELFDMAFDGFHRMQQILDSSSVTMGRFERISAFVAGVVIRMSGIALGLATMPTAVLWGYHWLRGQPEPLLSVALAVIKSPAYVTATVILAWIALRRILDRLDHKY